jgi:hypothetical protein
MRKAHSAPSSNPKSDRTCQFVCGCRLLRRSGVQMQQRIGRDRVAPPAAAGHLRSPGAPQTARRARCERCSPADAPAMPCSGHWHMSQDMDVSEHNGMSRVCVKAMCPDGGALARAKKPGHVLRMLLVHSVQSASYQASVLMMHESSCFCLKQCRRAEFCRNPQ